MLSKAKDFNTIFKENRGTCFRKISDAPWWSDLNFDSEQDEDLMFIEIWSSICSNEHFKAYRIIDASSIDDNHPDKEKIIEDFHNPGPNFVHPSIYTRGRILNDFESLSVKYGKDVFENYIRNLYNNYPTPQDQSTIEYITQNNNDSDFFLAQKWKLIAELFSSIHNYFEDRGESL